MRYRILAVFVAFCLLFVMLAGLLVPQGDLAAAPQAAVTVVAATDPLQGSTSLVTFYDGEVLTADDQNCIDLAGFRVLDLEYVVDQTVVATGVGSDGPQTTTVTLEHTNGAGATLATNTTGQTVVSANVADADAINRFDLYGRYTCVDLDLSANSNPVTWTIKAVARR